MGHIFQLGRKYAEALGLQVLDENGKLVTVTMGSYGIGVSRAVAAIAESTHDELGLCWPREIAPADVHLVATGKDPAVFEAAESLADELVAAGLTVLYDDRPKVSPGVKFKDAELLGMPTIVTVGRGLAEGTIEVRDRASGERQEVPVADGPLSASLSAAAGCAADACRAAPSGTMDGRTRRRGPLTVAGRVPGSAPAYPHASVRRATAHTFEEHTTHRGHQDQAHAPGQDARAVLPHRRRRRPHQARRPVDRDDRQVPPEGGPLLHRGQHRARRSTGSASAPSRPRPSPPSSGSPATGRSSRASPRRRR